MDFIELAAAALEVTVAELLGSEPNATKKKPGPTGKMKRLFEKASELPRHQQQKVTAVLEAFIAQQTLEKRNNFK